MTSEKGENHMASLCSSFEHSKCMWGGRQLLLSWETYATIGNNVCIYVYVMMIGWLYWCCALRSWRMTHKSMKKDK